SQYADSTSSRTSGWLGSYSATAANKSRISLHLSCTLHYKVIMNTIRRTIAATELVLIFPAVLFMTALFVRNLQPKQLEPAHTAQEIVMCYSARPHVGLWILLIAL